MKNDTIELKETDTLFYNVFEELKDIDKEAVELFDNEDMELEDIEDLRAIKNNLEILIVKIENKMNDIYEDVINDGM